MDRRWKILLLLFIARTGLGFQFQVLGSISPQLIDDLGFNYRQTGTLVGLFMLSGIVLSFPAGLAGRFTSDRAMVTGGLLALAAGGLVSSLGSGFYLIGFGRIISGAGFVLGTLYFAKMIADWFTGRELATAMGILVMSWPVGIALGQLIHPVTAAGFGYSSAFIVAAAYCVTGAVTVFVLYRQPDHLVNAPSDKSSITHTAQSGLSTRHWKLTLAAALAWGLFNAGYVVYLSFAHKLINENGFSLIQAAAIASLPSWIMLFSGITAGQIADRTGKSDLLLYLCMAGAVLSLLLLKNSNTVMAGAILFGVVGMAPAGIVMALTSEAMPAQSRAYGMGIFFTVYFIVVMPAPGIAGWLFDMSGNSFVPLQFAALLFAATAASNFAFRVIQAKPQH